MADEEQAPVADEAAAAEAPAAEEAPAAPPGEAEGAPADAAANATPATPGGPQIVPPVTAAQRAAQDPLNTEFLYYSSVLRILGPTLTKEDDRNYIIPWIRKLFRPEYHSSKLREKRNRYLAYLSTSLLLDQAIGVFRGFPPDGALPDCEALVPPTVQAAEWEVDKMWQDTLQGLPGDFRMLECCVHAEEAECKADHRLDKV
ncbi:unnamed protein product [Phaedon cochleariae]|uniref:DUF4485 domain-containing protein n=1 Tax=Phaedon cochleariae TaxID=80249 RepID=A0A9N9SH61_PHACE|nr:unnamed protein product [Phaedon cochleariae]